MFKIRIPSEKRLSQEAVTSVVIHGFYQLGASMSGIFLNLYLWRLTHDLFVNGMYNVINFVIASLGYAMAGKIAKIKDRLFAYRVGIVLFALFYLSVAFFQEKVAQFFYLFAVFNGLAGGFYWLGYLTLMYDVSTDQNRIRYLALNTITFNLAGIAGPALAGFIISLFAGLKGYIIVFSLAFVMFVITALGSFRLDTAVTHHKTYYLRLMGLVLKKNRQYAKGLVGYVVLGLHQGIMLFLPNILIFTVIPKEDKVGYVWGIFLGLSIATSYLLSRYGLEGKVRIYIVVASIGYILGAIGLISQISLLTVMMFLSLYFVCSTLQMNSYSAYYYQLIGKLPLKGNMRMETLVIRECSISLGRIISIFTLVLLAGDLNSPLLPWVLLGASVIQLSFIWLLKEE